jgi:hypothetical protein
MMIPKTKAMLLKEMEDGRQEWETFLGQIAQQRLEVPGVEGSFSIKDIVAHVAGYEQYAVALLSDLIHRPAEAESVLDIFYQHQLDLYRVEHPDFPAQLNDLAGDQVNALFVAARDSDTARQVMEFERQIYQQLVDITRAMPEAELVAPGKVDGRTLLEILPNQSYNHYRMHMPSIRRWLAQQSDDSNGNS